MNWKAAVASYGLAALSIIIYLEAPNVFNYSLGPPTYGIDYNALTYLEVSETLAIFGMILSPYFGAASLIVAQNSIWKETSALIQKHISFPFLGGVALFSTGFYGLGYFGAAFPQVEIGLTTYLLFVFFSTLLIYTSNTKNVPTLLRSPPSS